MGERTHIRALSAFQQGWDGAQKVDDMGVDYVDVSTELVTAWQRIVYACADNNKKEVSETVNAFRDLCEAVDTSRTHVIMAQPSPVNCARNALSFLLSQSFVHKPHLQSALLVIALNYIHHLDDSEKTSSPLFVQHGVEQLIAKKAYEGATTLLENIPRLLKGGALDTEAKNLLSAIAKEFANTHFSNNLRLCAKYN